MSRTEKALCAIKSGYGLDAPLTSLDSADSASYARSLDFKLQPERLRHAAQGHDRRRKRLYDQPERLCAADIQPLAADAWQQGRRMAKRRQLFLPDAKERTRAATRIKFLPPSRKAVKPVCPLNTDKVASNTAFNTYTIVSDGYTITVYLDGEKVTELDHSKDWSQILTGDRDGYIGKSLYTPDPLFSGASSFLQSVEQGPEQRRARTGLDRKSPIRTTA